MTTKPFPHRALPGCEFKLALARHAGADALATYMGLVRIADECDQAEADRLIAEARRLSHDAVITMLGPSRLTGVVWIVESGQAALHLLAEMSLEEGVQLSSYLPPDSAATDENAMADMIRAEPRSTLVIATAVVDSRVTAAALS